MGAVTLLLQLFFEQDHTLGVTSTNLFLRLSYTGTFGETGVVVVMEGIPFSQVARSSIQAKNYWWEVLVI